MTKLTLKSANRLAWLILTGLTIASFTYVVFPRLGTRGFAAPFAGSISGTAFEDSDGNGTRDTGEPGLVGVTVTATDNLGNTQTATTDSSGNYSLSSFSGTRARIEFSNPPTQPSKPSSKYAPTVAGNTSVQFLTLNGNQTGVNAGFINLTDWCKNGSRLAIPCWSLGAYNNADVVNEPVLVSTAYNTTALRNAQTYHARSGQMGST